VKNWIVLTFKNLHPEWSEQETEDMFQQMVPRNEWGEMIEIHGSNVPDDAEEEQEEEESNEPGVEEKVSEEIPNMGQGIKEKAIQIRTTDDPTLTREAVEKDWPAHVKQVGWPTLIAQHGLLLDHSPKSN
jgi:hypothetical protein